MSHEGKGGTRMSISWRDYVPEGRNGRILTLAMLVNAFGTGTFLAGGTIFFIRFVGLSNVELGVGLAVAAVFGMAVTVPTGAVADWIGPRPMLVLLYCWRAGAFAALAFVSGPIGFAVAASLQTAAGHASLPINQALVGAITRDGDRTRMMALIRSVRNVGFSIGALAAAPMLASDSLWLNRMVLLATAATLALSALLLLALRLPPAGDIEVKRANPFAALRVVRDWRYALLALANSVVVLHMTVLAVGLPLWVVAHGTIPAATVSVLVIVNTVLAVVFQVPFSKRVKDNAGGVRALRLACAALAATMLVLAFPFDVALPVLLGVAVVATVLLTAGELWHAAGSWELSYNLAVPETRTTYLSLFTVSISLQEMVGPLAVALAAGAGPWGWAALAVPFLAAAFVVGPVTGAVERHRAAGPQSGLREAVSQAS